MSFIVEKCNEYFSQKCLEEQQTLVFWVFVRLCNCEQVIWLSFIRHDVTGSGHFYKLFKELQLFKNLTLLKIVKLFRIWNISLDSNCWLSVEIQTFTKIFESKLKLTIGQNVFSLDHLRS